jgi:SHS2 domain-containing protein
MNEARYRFVEHTGEIEMNVTAESLPSLFEEAAHGLADLLAEDASGPPCGPEERVALNATDREHLLVDWLNELVYRGEVDKRVYSHVRVERIDEHELEATIRGREPRAPRTAVKAATWHGLRIRSVEHGFEATVVLDV